MNTVIICNDGKKIEQVSRWIRINTCTVKKKNNSLYDYAEDGVVNFFKFRGVKYPLARFVRFASMWTPTVFNWYDNDGKMQFLSGYDTENYYNPLLIEISNCGEYVRVYREIVEE